MKIPEGLAKKGLSEATALCSPKLCEKSPPLAVGRMFTLQGYVPPDALSWFSELPTHPAPPQAR